MTTLQERLRESGSKTCCSERKEAADALDAKDKRIKELEGVIRALDDEITEIDYRFTSANEVKIEKSTIPAKEWASLRDALFVARAALKGEK